ncbi:MAG: isoprenylcysteine carboxylmethyltransferase family protein [Bacteroidota bacterium]
MANKKDSPGVYIPPPLFYVLTFLAGVFMQKKVPLDDTLFHQQLIKIAGVIFLILALFFLIRSLRQFLRTKNTLITVMPANSLQSDGIYAVTRNPMYTGLAIVYLGLTCLIGNWWNLILFPLLVIIVQEFIIRREEKYLERRFGQDYLNYKAKVRRWI